MRLLTKNLKVKESSIIMAALMGMGTNIGLTKMADATPDISYRQMANVMQWRLHEDAMIHSQAKLVNFQHRLSLSSYFGVMEQHLLPTVCV